MRYCPTLDDPLPLFLARSYASNHPIMRDNTNGTTKFVQGTVQGAQWYTLLGGMQVSMPQQDCFVLTHGNRHAEIGTTRGPSHSCWASRSMSADGATTCIACKGVRTQCDLVYERRLRCMPVLLCLLPPTGLDVLGQGQLRVDS